MIWLLSVILFLQVLQTLLTFCIAVRDNPARPSDPWEKYQQRKRKGEV